MIKILIINCRKKIPIQFIIFIFQVGEVGSLGLQEMIYGVKKKSTKAKIVTKCYSEAPTYKMQKSFFLYLVAFHRGFYRSDSRPVLTETLQSLCGYRQNRNPRGICTQIMRPHQLQPLCIQLLCSFHLSTQDK